MQCVGIDYSGDRGSYLELTLFKTRVLSEPSSSSGVGGKGLLGAPLDDAPSIKIFETLQWYM